MEKLSLSDAYRKSRTTVGAFCGLSMAWSAAQIEFKSLPLGPVGELEMANASVPLVLVLAIGFTFSRLLVEYCMQPVAVRRWNLARTDLGITIWLVRASIVAVGVGALHRSLETLAGAFFAIAGLALFALANVFVTMMLIMPLMIWIRARQGRHSVASRVAESLAWAEFLTVVIMLVSVVGMGIASVVYAPIRDLFAVPPTPVSASVAVVSFVSVLLSIYLERLWYPQIVAEEPSFTREVMPDGTERITFHKNSTSSTALENT